MKFSKNKNNIIAIICVILAFTICVKSFESSNNKIKKEKTSQTAEHVQNDDNERTTGNKPNYPATQTYSGDPNGKLVLPENIGQIDTSNKTNYIENALLQNGKVLKFTKLPITVYIENNEYTDTAKKAFLEWQNKIPQISFALIQNPNAAKIQVKFLNGELGAKNGEYIKTGQTEYVLKNQGSELEKTIITISTENGERKLNNNVVYHTLLHEIGHAIGIVGHSADTRDIMSTANDLGKRDLTSRDIQTVKLLYSNTNFNQNNTMYKSARYSELKQILEKMPNDYSTWVQLGDFYFEGKHYSNAYKCYEYLTRLNPDNALGYARLALYFESQKDIENTYKNFEIAHIKDPTNSNYIYNLCVAAYGAKNQPTAKNYLVDFLDKNPNQKNDENMKKVMQAYGVE